MTDVVLRFERSGGTHSLPLRSLIGSDAEEQAHGEACRWIKGLRNLPVDGARFRDRFTFRGDSLWWFTELFLHKEQVILDLHRTIAALDALVERERPRHVEVVGGRGSTRLLVRTVAAARGLGAAAPALEWTGRTALLELRARRLHLAAQAAPDRFRRPPATPPPDIAAFVHRAFWKSGGEDGSAESYVGPVLRELEARVGGDGIRYVGVGPPTNFRSSRRRTASSGSVVPVERYGGRRALSPSRAVWRDRHRNYGILLAADSLRDAAVIKGADCWPIVREQLAGIAWLQWPWSARAMDEAGAALDALRPNVVLTYAEAGGWGRALVLEARRRRIPSAGLQHGFIYRHWLNYLHEPDEMSESELDGFPRPTRTLLFDEYAAEHLRSAGRFPASAVAVTGSPRLDALVREIAALPPAAMGAARARMGAHDGEHPVLVATKEREARRVLPALVEAAACVPGAKLAIKPHPAETAAAYAGIAAGRPHVTVLSADEPLAPLLAAARAVATVNSTVALDAGVVGVPALTIGLPNNLSPFVEAGAMAGTADPAELPDVLERILYDERFRQQLAARREAVLGRAAIRSDGGAAGRTAAAVLELLAGTGLHR